MSSIKEKDLTKFSRFCVNTSIIVFVLMSFYTFIEASLHASVYIISIFLFLIGVLSDKKFMQKNTSPFLSRIILLIFLTLFVSLVANGGRDFYMKTYSCVLFFFPCLFAFYLINTERPGNSEFCRHLTMLVYISILITSITTIIGLQIYPMASRILATGKAESEERIKYMIVNIGGYGFIYAAVLFVPILVKRIMEKKNQRFVLLFMYIIIFLCIMISQYSLAIVLFASTILLFQKKLTPLKFFVPLIIFVALAYIFNPQIEVLIEKFANFFNLDFLNQRIAEISNSLESGTTTGGVYNRFEDYTDSINTFLKNPIFGAFGKNANDLIGHHSETLDILGSSGLLGTALFSLMLYIYNRKNYIYVNSKNKTAIMLSIFYILAFATVNTAFISPTIGFISMMLPILYGAYPGVEKYNSNTVSKYIKE